jgi:selenocysteine-specific elongation factor
MNHGGADIILGTAGHIDHGKTALVKALTGIDTDRLPDEKRRGITIDLGFAQIVEGDTRISVIDVPGHERFVRNMLAGAGGFDMALLVVAADDGIMPQTLEHLEILDLLGIDHAIVVMTKCDLANEAWQDLVSGDLQDHLRGTRLSGSPILRVSTVTNQGIDALRAKIVESATRFRRHERQDPFRLSVDRVFVKPGQGVIVTGSVGSGVVRVGDEVEIFPGQEIARVRSLQVHGTSTDSAATGQRLAINLTGVKGDALARGTEVAQPGFLKNSRVIGVRLRAARNVSEPFRDRGKYELHLGTAQVQARLVLTPKLKETDTVAQVGLLVLSEPVPAVYGRPFVLRSFSPARTIGGGHVIDPAAKLMRRRDVEAWQDLARLTSANPDDRLEAWMSLRKAGRPCEFTGIRELGMTGEEIGRSVDALAKLGKIVRIGHDGRFELTRRTVEAVVDRIRRRISKFHAEHPRLTGMPVSQMIGRLPDLPRDLVRSVLECDIARSAIRARNGLISETGFSPQLTKAESRILETLRQEYSDNPMTPRSISEIADSTSIPQPTLLELARILVAESAIVEIGGGLFLAVPSCDLIREKTLAWFEEHASLTVSELRGLIGVSRKYAVPIAEWLDKSGLTRREGDLRFLDIPVV